MNRKPDPIGHQNPLARSCINPNPAFLKASFIRPLNAAQSLAPTHVTNKIDSTFYLSRPDAAWSDEERCRFKNEKRLEAKYKTSLCTEFTQTGQCAWGDNCRFAHGMEELRSRPVPKNAKTVLCKNFEETGVCPYAGRCLFIHRKKPNGTDNNIMAMSLPYGGASSFRQQDKPIQHLQSNGAVSPEELYNKLAAMEIRSSSREISSINAWASRKQD